MKGNVLFPKPVFSLGRNQCPLSAGMPVHFGPELVFTFHRNECPFWTGTGVQFAPEYTSCIKKYKISELYFLFNTTLPFIKGLFCFLNF
ncbi:hypothetical protein D2962_14645 [Biomaibacter acetigenes]|uniref:Uncharacterized protein n=1 Tax=Biomaibacter acetigenes TaxID=2316383 RepID=A0A3G2R8E6_9FIRM|nr:hypothetical protein D2962_14645 [Biomaibacter acetigenes]RKL62638.1 hypothetical protein DXT63_10755 [Thermoanaerobacteraceae bacterium SP2]